MFWELLATLIAGLGMAGIALSLRKMFKKLPRWIIPAMAGLGMIGFQVYHEYSWFSHTASRLPTKTVVLASAAKPVFYQPWSYYHAPTRWFVAVDTENIKEMDAHIKATQLYFFERRMPALPVPVLVDCQNGVQSDFKSGSAPTWGTTTFTNKLVQAVCS